MKAKFSPQVQKEISRVKEKDTKLYKRIQKQVGFFEENPKHPSLRTHKLSGELQEPWSISVTMNIRMVYILIDKNTALFVKIGTHNEVYSK